MKVLHISTTSIGGAAIAAHRLHEGLLKLGIESRFLCLTDQSYTYDDCLEYYSEKESIPKNNEKIHEIKNQSHWGRLKTLSKGNYDLFSLPIGIKDVHKLPVVEQADIIHLHWIANFIHYPIFFRKIKVPIVWTLHDKNPACGGFHLRHDYFENQHLQMLDNTLANYKRRMLKPVKKLAIACPSIHIKEFSEQSIVLKAYPHFHIPNGIDSKSYRILDKKMARKILRLPQNKTLILFSSYHRGIFKGIDILIQSLEKIRNKKQFSIVTTQQLDQKYVDEYCLGKIHNEGMMNLVYSAVDATLITSREENFPNVMLESLACGIPVVSTPVGGTIDIIENNVNGYLSKDDTPREIAIKIEELQQNKKNFIPKKIKEGVIRKCELSMIAKRYLDLYNGMTEK